MSKIFLMMVAVCLMIPKAVFANKFQCPSPDYLWVLLHGSSHIDDQYIRISLDNNNFLFTNNKDNMKSLIRLKSLDCSGLHNCTCNFQGAPAPSPSGNHCQYPTFTVKLNGQGCAIGPEQTINSFSLLHTTRPTPVPPIEPLEPIVPVPQPIVPQPQPLEPANVTIHTPELKISKPYVTLGLTNLYRFNDCAGGAPNAYCIMGIYLARPFETTVDGVSWTINFVAHKPGAPHVADPTHDVYLATEASVIPGNHIKLTYKLANGDTAFELISKAPLNCTLPPVGVDGKFKLVGDKKHIECWSRP